MGAEEYLESFVTTTSCAFETHERRCRRRAEFSHGAVELAGDVAPGSLHWIPNEREHAHFQTGREVD
ncbi:MAG TPA: hypothetical protein VMU64_05005 [Acidimicrobiales bacterium]|nr:hypothetical protein [Acidimicrobiales bacterium]